MLSCVFIASHLHVAFESTAPQFFPVSAYVRLHPVVQAPCSEETLGGHTPQHRLLKVIKSIQVHLSISLSFFGLFVRVCRAYLLNFINHVSSLTSETTAALLTKHRSYEFDPRWSWGQSRRSCNSLDLLKQQLCPLFQWFLASWTSTVETTPTVQPKLKSSSRMTLAVFRSRCTLFVDGFLAAAMLTSPIQAAITSLSSRSLRSKGFDWHCRCTTCKITPCNTVNWMSISFSWVATFWSWRKERPSAICLAIKDFRSNLRFTRHKQSIYSVTDPLLHVY